MDNFDPCSDYYVNAYLNDPDVQKALHANVTRLDHPWSACRYTSPSVPLLPKILKVGLFNLELTNFTIFQTEHVYAFLYSFAHDLVEIQRKHPSGLMFTTARPGARLAFVPADIFPCLFACFTGRQSTDD